jgi:NifB/MoaA-like Fe-S oxidoreductase
MHTNNKLEIESVDAGSPAAKAGLRKGDKLISINSAPLRDVIDFMFNIGSEELEIEFMRNTEKNSTLITIENGTDLGITVKPFKIKTCRNNCIFCLSSSFPNQKVSILKTKITASVWELYDFVQHHC